MPLTPSISAATAELVHDLGVFPPAPAGLWNDPSVLRTEWTPRALVGTDGLLAELATSLPARGGSRVASVLTGPPGVGASAVASRLIDLALSRMAGGPGVRARPLLLRLDAVRRGPRARSRQRSTACSSPARPFTGPVPSSYSSFSCAAFTGLVAPPSCGSTRSAGTRALARTLLPLHSPERLMPRGADGLPPILYVTSCSCDPIVAIEGYI